MANTPVGNLSYTIEGNAEKLIQDAIKASRAMDDLAESVGKAANDAEESLDNISSSARKTGDEVNRLNPKVKKLSSEISKVITPAKQTTQALEGLKKAAIGYMTISGLMAISKIGEDYKQMAEKIRAATDSQEEFNIVQESLLATALESNRSLKTYQDAFVSINSTLKGMGYSTAQVLDILESLGNTFTRSSTSAEGAERAISALNKSFGKGKVEADNWETIQKEIPSIVENIAASMYPMSKNIDEAKKKVIELGYAGQLTGQNLANGLYKSLEENKNAASQFGLTIEGAMQNLTTSFENFIGKANEATGASTVISGAIDLLSRNIETVSKVLFALGAGALARYITLQGIALASTVKASAASLSRAYAEEVQAMRIRATTAAEQARQATLTATTAAQRANAASLTQQAALLQAEALAAANATKAQIAYAAAKRAASVAGSALLGVIGGPAGIISLLTIAATSWFMFSGSTKEASTSLINVEDDLSRVNEQISKMTRAQVQIELGKKLEEQAESADYAAKKLREVDVELVKVLRSEKSLSNKEIFEMVDALVAAYKAGKELSPELDRLSEKYGIPRDKIESVYVLAGQFDNNRDKANRLNEILSSLRGTLGDVGAQARGAASDVNTLSKAFSDAARLADEFRTDIANQMESLNWGKESSNMVRAMQKVRELNKKTDFGQMSTEEKAEFGRKMSNMIAEAKQLDILTQKKEEERKAEQESKRHRTGRGGGRSGAKSKSKGNADGKNSSLKSQKDGVKETIEQIERLNQQIKEAGLSGEELIRYQAKISTNKWATPEQVSEIENLSVALEKARRLKNLSDNIDKYDPLQGENKRYNEELENIKALNEAKLIENETYYATLSSLEREHQENVNRIQEESFARQSELHQLMMDTLSTFESASATAFTSFVTGTATAKEALQGLANTVLNEVISSFVQMGIAQVKAIIMGKAAQAAAGATYAASVVAQTKVNSALAAQAAYASTAAIPVTGPSAAPAAAAAAATASEALGAPAVAAAPVAGKRLIGGSVEKGKAYQVNENKRSELLSFGDEQYLIPNKSGRIISNARTQGMISDGGANMPVTIKIINNGEPMQVGSSSARKDKNQIEVNAELIKLIDGIARSRASEAITNEMRTGGQLNQRGIW